MTTEVPYKGISFGAMASETSTTFTLYFPTARSVECVLYREYNDRTGTTIPMTLQGDGIWNCTVEENLKGQWYHYKVTYQKGKKPKSAHADQPFADPYSRHVAVQNHYTQQPKTYITGPRDNFDWDDDRFMIPEDPRDLIIYETHIKDLVFHPSAESNGSGIYNSWTDLQQKGGIPYLKSLGVNAVEFLPLHKFPYFEPPYHQKTSEGFHNTWNTYSRNHWGYMTSFFFAPETLYASDEMASPGKIRGLSPAAVSEFKSVIKELHANGISVIMDVVFNHSSLFDINMIAHHLPDTYLRKDEKGQYMNRSWTGNEIRTEHPVVRKLITDSIRYWTEEFHIDGFRFDLAGLIDEGSWDAIRESAKEINPNALLIAEPWGGRYVPWLFSNHGWSAWNDRIRNGIKGSDPVSDKGFIFSGWHHGGDREQLENWFMGTIRSYPGGLFADSSHSVNYLESHDGYTLGDFIRIACRYHSIEPVIQDREEHLRLTSHEMKIAKLGAFCLFVSQGIVMIHSGQEFARSKIIEDKEGIDPDRGKMDRNSYNKDDETNWIDFGEIDFNRELYLYYKGLIRIRKESPGLRKAEPDQIRFSHYHDPLHVCFHIRSSGTGDLSDYYVAINGTGEPMTIDLPAGSWEILVDENYASISPLDFATGKKQIGPHTAILFRKLNH
ncbi:MAG: alpha-amylase family glycosyl hydrolase [Balneolaceae bacterium]